MKNSKISIRNVIAYILMAVNFLNILILGYGLGENRTIYSAATYINTEDMYLTFKEDASYEKNDKTVIIPKGTVVKPADIITIDRIGFFYPTEGYSFEEIKQMSYSEREEKGIIYFSDKPERFEECEEIERLWNEASKQVKAVRTKVILKIFLIVLGLSLIWLAVWFFLTRFLCGKKMYVLLYLLNVIFWFAVYIGISTMLIH